MAPLIIVYQSYGFRYDIYNVWIGCPTGWWWWVGGWVVVVFAETKDQQGLINYVALIFETEICLKIRGTGRKSFKD